LLWITGLSGLLGGVIGLRYRAPALIPATLCALAWAALAGWLAGNTAAYLALVGIAVAVTLQVAYLAGLALRSLVGR